MARLILIVFLALAACSQGARPYVAENGSVDLPVTRAVLYQNGVGYFERRGVAKGDIVLRAKPSQIGDFLKTLTVVSLSGGQAVSAAMPAELSYGRSMADLPEQIRKGGGLLAMASAFRGAHVVVRGERGTAEGRLLGTESLDGTGNNDAWRLSVLTDAGGVRVFKLSEVDEIKVLDKSLELGLEKSLDAALGAASWKPVDVVVRLDGPRKQDVVVSYLVEMTKWRPAYRVVLTDSGEALFQAWAVVDNLSGEDWNDVQLSLVSGTPLTFRYNLYTPRFGRRPDLTPPENEATAAIPEAMDVEGPIPAAPAMNSGAFGMAAPPPPSAAPAPSRSRAMRKMRNYDAEREERPVSDAQIEQSFGSLVSGNAVGAVFRYDIEAPVTIRDQESALVMLVNKRVHGEEAWLYRAGQDGAHPYRAARVASPSDTVLERGPASIYRSGTFLGEAMAGHIEAGATAFFPFAVDGRVRIESTQSSREEDAKLVKIVGGQITVDTKSVVHYAYTVTNTTDEAKTLWIAMAKRVGWNLAKPPQGTLEQSGHYYVPVKLAAQQNTAVELLEETPSQRRMELMSDAGRRLLLGYLTRPEVSAQNQELVHDVQEMFAQLDSIDAQSQAAEQQKAVFSQRQAEVRANLQSLGKAGNADLRKTLEHSLAEAEEHLEELARKIVTLSIQRQEVRDKLTRKLASITLD